MVPDDDRNRLVGSMSLRAGDDRAMSMMPSLMEVGSSLF
jgi:hypothetical protein